MAKDYLSEFLPDLEEFRTKTMQFHNKELSVAEYKAFSGGFGSYAQRGGEKHMLRLRMAGGRLTKDRLEFVVKTCEKYHINFVKLTTCQSIQLHNLEAENLCEMMEEAWRAGMISRGGGGDFPRNVMASPLSGVQKDECFDVMPYAEAAGEYLMQFIKAVKFPRKLKVSFSSNPANEPHSTFRDMGFCANANGTFDVYICGGLGNNPSLGVKVATNIDGSKILYYIKAMVNTFVTYGNYENRAKSRTRYLKDTLGIDGLINAYTEQLKNVMESEQLDIDVSPYVIHKIGDSPLSYPHKRVVDQKQSGLYSIFYQPLGGKITPTKLKELYEVIKDMDDVEIRITPDEALYVINCNASEAQKVLEITNDGANTLFETSVACVGASTCQVGLGDSPALLARCIEAVKKENFPDGVLPKIHISGCPSSCGTHQIAAIGFRGAMKPTPEGPKPAFAIFEGGNDRQGEEVIAGTGKAITVDEIPNFLVELGRMVHSEGMVYEQWIQSNHDKLVSLIEKYTA